MRRLVPLVLLVAALFAVSSAAESARPLSALLDRATAYASAYMREFATLVAEERYIQDARPQSGGDPSHVELRSDLLFVQPDLSGNWVTFRDVFSVNGQAVRDRDERLVRLFVQHPPDTSRRALDIVREGYRYDIASRDRTVANPLLVLAFLQPVYRARFEFTLGGIDSERGRDIWTVKFRERARPTIIRTTDDANVAASGRLWIDGATGRVLRTELQTSTGDRVMTMFVFDERLRMDVPSEMRDLAWYGGTRGMIVTGSATYVNFRRFEVTTDHTFR